MSSLRHRHAAGVALALVVAACADSSTAPLAPELRSGEASIVDLNPQPEPPSLQLDFTMTLDGDAWFGTISVGGQTCGSVQLNPQPEPPAPLETETGIVTHLAYDLSIQGDNPDFLLDADVDGIVEQNHMVLNGLVSDGAYAGQTIHPRGDITEGTLTDFPTTLTGAVQLNPQPEPPAPAYPPSPCTG